MGGAQSYLLNNTKEDFCIHSHTNKIGRLWANTTLPEIIRLITGKSRGIYEIIAPTLKRKVYFDVDGIVVLQDVIDTITQKFPNANLHISGNTEPKNGKPNASYHIVLSNYYFTDQNQQKVLKRWVMSLPEALGIDQSVYTTNRLMKCINQSKLDGRIQKYISGSSLLSKHLILHDFDEDAIDATTLEWTMELLKKIGRDEVQFDPSIIPQQDLDAPDIDWNVSTVQQRLCLLYTSPSPRD